MKRKRWICAALLCMGLVLGMVTTSGAAARPEPAQPMAQECGNCGKMRLLNQFDYGAWVYVDEVLCKKWPDKTDSVLTRIVHMSVKCSNCGFTADLGEKLEYKTICPH